MGVVINTWNSHSQDGIEFDLSHLSSFRMDVVQPATDKKPERTWPVVVDFSIHCFTIGPNKHKGQKLHDWPKEYHYSDVRETRIFCPSRYELSKHLPEIVKGIAGRKCFHSGKGNFFTIETLGPEGVIEYEIYFNLVRSSKRGELRLYIESAYVRDDNYSSSQPKKKPIGFYVLAHNVSNNRPIKVPR